MKKTAVLAYSGGLDTSYCISYLSKELGHNVHAIHVNTGGVTPEKLATLEQRAYALGAVHFQSIDQKKAYYDKVIKYLIYGNVLRNESYPLSVSSERILQALTIAEYASGISADFVCHGSTGAGNDQVRFDLVFHTLIPDVSILSPIRDQKLSRSEEVNYLKSKGYTWSEDKKQYSINQGLWGTTVGGAETLTSHLSLPESAYPNKIRDLPAREISIGFEKGEILHLDGVRYDHPVGMIEALNDLGGKYAIGRDTHVGDTCLGIKGRVAFEAPAAMILIKAHHLLEKHTLTKWQQYWKKQLADWYGMLMHEGQFLDPVMRNIETFLIDTQKHVSGEVFVKLQPYHFTLKGIQSDYDLMQAKFGVYGEMNHAWDGDEARAFIKLMATPFKLCHELKPEKEWT